MPAESLEGVDPCVRMLLDRGSFIAEQYRAVRTRLLSHNPLGEPWILGITSSIPREGKSVTTINLGFAISELRHLKVVLVDADLRHSSLARMLNISGSPGLTEAIRGEADYRDVVRPMYQSNFAVVPAGSLQTDNPAQLLASRRTGEMLRFLRSEYHYVLVDTPPANSFADVGIIGQICTGVLMVVRMNRTREPAAKRAIRLLQSNNINVLGCVLTAIRETGRQQDSYY
jgi:protein-tyrosine kinase